MNRFRVFFLFLISGLIAALFLFNLVLADLSSTLRPNADGIDDSASWTNTAGTACSGADCYLEVDESSGASCTNSDGDTSYVQSSTNGANQTFDVDESGVPDGATVTQIAITACAKKSGGGSTYQTRYCHNGSCSNSGSDISTGAQYTEAIQNHTVNFTKNSSSDIEIGVVNTTNNKTTRLSQISVVITYSTPAPSATPTPTPTPSDTPTPTPTPSGTPTPSTTPTPTPSETPTPTPSESSTPTPTQEPATVETTGTGGPAVYPAELVFSGEAYPGAKIQINLLSDFFGKVLEKSDEYTVGDTGTFILETKGNSIGEQFYGLSIKDRDGNLSTAKFYTYDLKFNTTIKQENIILAPMASISKKIVAKSESFTVSGYGAPNNKIEVLSDGKVVGTGMVAKDGSYTVTIDGGKLFLGPHKIQARQVDDTTGKVGDLSGFHSVTVGQFSYTSVDMNKDDKIDIADWSIFLYNWSSPNEETKNKNDLNSDGIVDVTDFSVFLTSFQNHL